MFTLDLISTLDAFRRGCVESAESNLLKPQVVNGGSDSQAISPMKNGEPLGARVSQASSWSCSFYRPAMERKSRQRYFPLLQISIDPQRFPCQLCQWPISRGRPTSYPCHHRYTVSVKFGVPQCVLSAAGKQTKTCCSDGRSFNLDAVPNCPYSV